MNLAPAPVDDLRLHTRTLRAGDERAFTAFLQRLTSRACTASYCRAPATTPARPKSYASRRWRAP